MRALARAYGRGLWDGRAVLAYTILLSLTLFIVAPFLMIALRSVGKGWFGKLWFPPQLTLEWYRWAIEVGNIPEVLRNTVIIGVIAVAISTTIGLFAGWAFGRRRLPGKELVLALFLLPLMIPSITYALGVARIFYALELVDTHFGVALAHVAVCAPYAIMVLAATFEGLDERVLEAASVCGAGPVRRFFHVVLPLVMPGILASAIFTFTHSYNEFTLTLLTYGPHTVTLPVRTYLAVGDGYWEITSAMAVLMVAPSLLILALVQRRAQPERLVGGFKGRDVPDPMIELRAITARYGAVVANDRLDLTVHRGELLTLLGPSGCGKTTALRTLTGHVRPESGRVVIDGRDVTDLPTHRRELGMVFQNFALFPHMTVRDNVGFPLMIRGVSAAERATRVGEALRLVRLEGHAEKHPRQLSGGQQQRVGLARALVYRPKVLLLDEPLSNLDAKLREEMRFEIREVVTRLGVTAVYVTHDQEEALALSDRIAIMYRGRIEQLGTPEDIYARPASRFVAEFVGLSSFLEGVIEVVAADGMRVAVGGGHVTVPALPGAAPGGRALLFVRPSEVELLGADAAEAGALRATVEAATYLGDRMDYRLRLDGGAALRVQRDGGPRLVPGASLRLRLPHGRVRALSDRPADEGTVQRSGS